MIPSTLSLISPLTFQTEEDFIHLAKEKRNVEIRSPKEDECETILSNFYSGILGYKENLDEDEFKVLINQHGKKVKDLHHHRVVVLRKWEDADICGAIHFHIAKTANQINKLVIHSLHILPSEEGQGFGSLLLSFAFCQAQRETCKEAKLKTTPEGCSCMVPTIFVLFLQEKCQLEHGRISLIQ